MSWITALQRAVESPPFEDAAQEIQAANVRLASIIIFVSVFVAIPLTTTMVGVRPWLHAMQLLPAGVSLISLGLLRRKYLMTAGVLLAATLWLVNAGAVWAFHPLLGPTYGGFVVMIVAAGMLAGTGGAVVAAAASVLLGFYLMTGVAAADSSMQPGDWASWTMYFTLVAGLLAVANHRVVMALRGLEMSQQRFRLLTEGMRDLVSEFDESNRILYASPNHAKVVGRSPEELVGTDVFAFSHLDDRRRVLAEIPDGPARHDQVPVRYLHSDGSWRQLEINALSYRGPDGGRRTMAVSRDVTERSILEEQLRQAQRLESVGRLSGGIAHDFNNLLTVIRGYAETLQRERPAEELDEIISASDKAASLIRRLLAFSRRQSLQPRVVDLNEVMRGIEPLLVRLLGEDIAMEMRLCDEPARLLVDPEQLEQVIVNLAVNARDAMPEGGSLELRTQIEGEALPTPDGDGRSDAIVLTVSDSGHGMDEDTLGHIFDPFYTTKQPGTGTGLGLSTVHGIVSQTGGSIEVDSKPGDGTTFKIKLPRTLAAVTATQEVASASSQRSIAGLLVMVAEDNEPLRRLLVRELEAQGCHVTEACDGADALAQLIACSGAVDVVVSDIVMPGLGGVDLRTELAQRYPEIRTVLISGHGGEREGSELLGVEEVLRKPFSPSDLVNRIRALLG